MRRYTMNTHKKIPG